MDRLKDFQELFYKNFEKSFPNLEEVELKVADLNQPMFDNFEKISIFRGYKFKRSPFEFLSRLKNAKSVLFHNNSTEYSFSRFFPPFKKQEVLKLPALRHLKLEFPEKDILLDELLLIFTMCPNLENFSSTFARLDGFDETKFCQFIVNNKSSFANLKRLNLNLIVKGCGLWTPKSVLALISNTGVQHLETLFKVSFTSKEMDELRGLAADKGLHLIHVVKETGWFGRWIACSGKKHTPVKSCNDFAFKPHWEPVEPFDIVDPFDDGFSFEDDPNDKSDGNVDETVSTNQLNNVVQFQNY